MKRRLPISALLLCLAVLPVRAAETLPLAGEWRFALDRTDVGTNEHWFANTLPGKINLPGILESGGYGDEISTATPWVLSLYDHFWFLRADYAAYTNAGSVKVPFISQPKRHYLGAAWYQRDIEIPTNWSGQRVVLFLERPHWKTTVWLDEKEIGSDISLCTPHEFELGMIVAQASRLRDPAEIQKLTGGTPVPLEMALGKHRLTVRVDNRMILPYRPDAHSVSDSLDNAWNGIAGKMELRATPPVWIEDVQVFPDSERKTVLLKFHIGNSTGLEGDGRIDLMYNAADPHSSFLRSEYNNGTNVPVHWSTNGAEVEIICSWKNNRVGVWSEFEPTLQRMVFIFSGGASVDARQIIFGLRNFRADGTQFILNGRPIYLRGTHFGGDFPLTGYPPTDVESWKKIFLTCKSYGLNHMRFHSWCPPEAAFTAADELGFYLQVEPGMWNSFAPGSEITKQLYTETEHLIKAYGNHPSLLLISASNEAAGRWKQVLPDWVKHFRAADPRHLYTPDTGWSLIETPDEPLNGGADYLAIGRVGPNRVRGEKGWFGGDYGDSIAGVNVPVISHEVGQWCAYPDFDVIQKFTGFMRPGNYEIFRDSAVKHGLLEQNKNFAYASGRLQLACYKEEIEAALRTPGLAGFQLLDLHDYTGQGTALIGVLDPFWESKGYGTSDEFKKFCNPVVPLAWLNKRVFTTDEKLEADIGMANFGPETLKQTHVMWFVYDKGGKRVAGGFLLGPARDLPVGFRDKLYHFSTGLANLPAPAEYKLVATKTIPSMNLTNESFQNDWNFWLYPAIQPPNAPIANFLETSSPSEATKALGEGKKVLFIPRLTDLNWLSPPLARVPVFWNALMGPTWTRFLGLWCDTNSPALAEFPTEANCDWQWTELIRNSRAVNLDNLPRGLKPIVSAIDDWNRNYKLGVIFEARVGTGKLLVCTADLNAAPAGPQLRRSLTDYMASDKFQPATEISTADFESLFFDNLVMRKLGATATGDGKPAKEILDGDPNTYWSSADARGNGPKLPHEIQIRFPQPVTMNGLLLMPRQNQREHQGDIREFKLETSNDGVNWRTLLRGQLASTWNPQTISFKQTLTAKHLKLTAVSGFGTDQSTAFAELAVIYAGPKLPDNNSVIEYRRVRTASTDIDAGDAPVKPAKKKPQQQ